MLQLFYEPTGVHSLIFLHEFGGIWLHDGPWSQTKGYINRGDDTVSQTLEGRG